MKPLAIAFDVHGTLAHWPAPRVRPIEVQRLLANVGIDISYQAFEAARQSVFMIEGVKRPIQSWTDFLSLQFDRMGVRVPLDVLPTVAHLYEQRDAMELYPDALDALRAAKASGFVTLAFTSLPAFMLGQAGAEIMPLLDHYFDNGLIGYAKGSQGFYREIARRMDMRADRILAVGDDQLCDCIVPHECGWQAVWLDRRTLPAEEERTLAADAARTGFKRIRTLSELPAHYT